MDDVTENGEASDHIWAASKLYFCPMQRDQEVIDRWTGSKHREIIKHMFTPVTEALVDDGKIGSRQTVLDIATGPGGKTCGA